MNKTPFELNMDEQPDALRKVATAALQPEIAEVLRRKWGRVVFAGMGSSHFAAHPIWQYLAAKGIPAWNVDAGVLIDCPGLLTPDTLVVATSQSGGSGEIVELLDRRADGKMSCGYVLGITSNAKSALASRADGYVDILSGAEATVSTKSYLNTLATLYKVRDLLLGGEVVSYEKDILQAAQAVEVALATSAAAPIAARSIETPWYRLAAVARGADIATAWYAALITKEAAKVAIEGYAGGEFRHGPLELAGRGMTAFFYGADSNPDDMLTRLIRDTQKTGAEVVTVGEKSVDGTSHLRADSSNELTRLSTSAVVAQQVAVALARANSVEPGAFIYGQKVTSSF